MFWCLVHLKHNYLLLKLILIWFSGLLVLRSWMTSQTLAVTMRLQLNPQRGERGHRWELG